MGLYAIGDVHGCVRTLDALLDQLALTPDDELVFVGDYVDRGPDSRATIERLIEIEAASEAGTGPRTLFLRGNHDQMMLNHADGVGDFELWRTNGGLATLASYEEAGDRAIPDAHVAFLERTQLAYDTEHAVFVHAGLDPSLSVAENLAAPSSRVFLWTRAHLDADLSRWEKPVVTGHTPVANPTNTPHLINVDTGAVYVNRRPELGKLTAVSLPDRTFTSVRCIG